MFDFSQSASLPPPASPVNGDSRPGRPPGCREILGEVARGLNLRPEDILGGKRRPDLVLARQVAMYLCRQKLGLSYPELGRAFGGRDHSTVIHACKSVENMLVTDPLLKSIAQEIEKKIVKSLRVK